VNNRLPAWVKEWEHDAKEVNDPVSEAQLLQKYKNHVFSNPNKGIGTKHGVLMEKRKKWMVYP
jgi:hypothetical protein